jgi:AcrR family transcriptional regulator
MRRAGGAVMPEPAGRNRRTGQLGPVEAAGRRVSQQQWVEAALELLAEGTIPADMSVTDLAARVRAGLTKGSFYQHFHGVGDLHDQVIAHWARGKGPALDGLMRAVRSPLDRLRLLRARAVETAAVDATMRRWAARNEPAAAAVRNADQAAMQHTALALAELGYEEEEAGVLAAFVVHGFIGAYHTVTAQPPDDPERFETLLAVLCRAAGHLPAAQGGIDADTISGGGDPEELIIYLTARRLPPAGRERLRLEAQRLASQLGDPGASSGVEGAQAPASDASP